MKSSNLLLLLALASPAASAQNLLFNGTFDEDIAGWQEIASQDNESLWAPDDANDDPNSGSIRLERRDGAPGGGIASFRFQCIPMEPGQEYELQARYRILPEAMTDTVVYVLAAIFNQADCTGGFTGLQSAYEGFARDTWDEVEFSFGQQTISTDQSGRGLRIALGVAQPRETMGEAIVLLDDVVLLAPGIDPPDPATTREYLSNRDFDNGVDGWEIATFADVAGGWSSDDFEGSMQSGSGELANLRPGNNGTTLIIQQCIAVRPMSAFNAAGNYQLVAGTGTAGYWVTEFALPDCQGQIIRSGPVVEGDIAGGWRVLAGPSRIISDPAAWSWRVGLGATKPQGVNDDLIIRMDGLSLLGPDVPAGSMVFGNGFE